MVAQSGGRGGFSSRLGFVAAAAGSAVGLGNIWRFPSEAGEGGGGIFLIIYLALAFFVGFPIMVGEISMGRAAGSDAYGAYRNLSPKRQWGIVGLFGILCGFMILSFYNVVAGWAFGYFIQIGFGDLLSTPKSEFGNYFGAYASDFTDNLVYSIVFMVLTAIIVMRGVKGGIETASKVLMPLLFVILIGLIVYTLTLDGAMAGVKAYLTPDFSKLEFSTLFGAAGQAFFSLSLGMGALITYGSYFGREQNILSSTAIVIVADVSVAFLAGMLIFPLVALQGGDMAAGPGLVFVALPGVFQEMGPVLGKVVGGGFFLLLCFAALTSTISLLEVPVAYFVDEKKWPRRTTVMVLAAVIFLIGLPSMLSLGAVDWLTNFSFYEGKSKEFLTVIDDVFSTASLPLGGALMSIYIAYQWKMKNFADEVQHGVNRPFKGSFIYKYISFMLMFVCPLLLFTIFLGKVFGMLGITLF